jgi:PQQ-dependent dehydrogenase (s-GDH family)
MKKPLLTLVLTLVVNYMFGQANCASAYDFGTISGNCTNQSGSLYLAASANPTGNSCGNRPSQFYRFTVPANSTTVSIKVTRTGSSSLADNNTFIEVSNATATACAGITGTNGGCNDISTLRTYLVVAGSTYYIRINTSQPVNGSATGYNYTICVTSNDNACTATTLVPGVPFYLSSVSQASASTGFTAPACATGTANDDVWFQFTPGAANATINLFGIAGSFSTSGVRVQVYNGTCAAPTAIVGACASGSTATLTMNMSGLSTSTVYYIRIYAAGAGVLAGTNGQFSISVTPLQPAVFGSGRMNEIFRQTTLSGPNVLDDPWEVTYGPDGLLWVTEAKGYKMHRIDPNTGVDQVVLDLTQGGPFALVAGVDYRKQYAGNGPQGGMMGMAIHPEFMTDPLKRFVYLAYVHDFVGTSPTLPTGEVIYGDFYRTWIVKFTWNGTTLGSPEKICDTIRGSNDHNSGRMIIAPYGGTNYLFYAVGDMGGGQFGNIQRPNHAQNIMSCEGKIMRYNLESDGQSGFDNFIPDDNPYNIGAWQSPVWSKGIRNNQGFAYAKIWGRDIMYGTSHGPFSDDELNIIDRRKNYGHPVVIGYAADGNYDGARAGQITYGGNPSNLPVISSETFDRDSINTANPDSYRDPIYSFYDTAKGDLVTVNSVQYIYNNVSSAYTANGSWASEAPSGMDFYSWSNIPNWKNSVVVASLKKGRVLRLRLNNTGLNVIKTGTTDTISYFGGTNRFRDLAFSPSGKDMFVVMEKSSTSSGPSSSNPIVPACAGCLQKYTFLGYNVNTGSGNRSYIPTIDSVAAGKPLPATFELANKVVINAANGNNNLWVPITDTNSNVVAEINARGLDLDTVTTVLYTRTGISRIKNTVKYLNRNITISPKLQPGGSIWIRLYISKTEYDQLVTDGGVGSIGALKILKNNDSCQTTISSTAAIATTNIAEAFGSYAYVLQGDISAFASTAGLNHAASFYFATSLVTLPVELLTFKGTLQNNATLLQWKTAQEINSSHFDVERSIDGSNFTGIGVVAAQGNSTTETDYSYIDNDVTTLPVTVVYYRLKIVDENGAFKYSNVVSITLPTIAGAITIAPNPVVHEATVKIDAAVSGKIQWNVTDNGGRVVMQNFNDLKKGRNILSIDLSKLAAGVYYFNVQGAGLDQHIKLQKE